MIKRSTLLLLVLFAFTSVQAQGLKGFLKKAKDQIAGTDDGGQVGMGLKEALNTGVGEAVSFLSAEDGYYQSAYKILLPEDVKKVTNRLKAVPGFGNVEADLIEKMNRAAEDAANKAKPIFVEAIKKMTFKDAMNLLMGEKDAATRYLEGSTFESLYGEFKPVIIESLDKVNAREYWKTAVTAYNKIPFVKKTNPELDDYVTRQALSGMFGMVEKKELEIREDPAIRSTELLQKVFARQDKK